MNASTPILIDDQTYPKYCANLAVTSFYKTENKFEVNASLKLIPTRFDDQGNVFKSEENSRNILLGSLQDANEEELEAVNKIYNAIQHYINVKGL